MFPFSFFGDCSGFSFHHLPPPPIHFDCFDCLGTFELFNPSIAIITNADWDHVDHYKTRDDVINAFTRFADGRKENGILIICAEDDGAKKVGITSAKHGSIFVLGESKRIEGENPIRGSKPDSASPGRHRGLKQTAPEKDTKNKTNACQEGSSY